jgi:hypothetical protein
MGAFTGKATAYAKARLGYALAALVIFAAIVYIALFVNNYFVRGWIGDVLVVILIHCALRVILIRKPRILALYVFLFSCLVELLQYIQLQDMLGLGHIAWLRIVVGGTFDWIDILCYAIGCLIIGLLEYLYAKRSNHLTRKPTG